MVIAQEPDIVFGLPDGVTREAMADAGAQVVVQNIYCATGGHRSSFETLYEQIDVYGRIFDHGEQAATLTSALQERVAAVTEAASDLSVATAAVLYPSVGGGPLYTYGAASMVTAPLDALGIENVFTDTEEREFDIKADSLMHGDPDVLILPHQTHGDRSVVH